VLRDAAESLLLTYRRLANAPVMAPRQIERVPVGATALSKPGQTMVVVMLSQDEVEISIMRHVPEDWISASALLLLCGGRSRISQYVWSSAVSTLEERGLLERHGLSRGTLYRRRSRKQRRVWTA
jgi:hypothetical protein